MSELRIYPDPRDLQGDSRDDAPPIQPLAVLTRFEAIRDSLRKINVDFERWRADRELHPLAPQDEIIEAYREPISRLMQTHGFTSVDVISVTAEHPQKEVLRQKFLQEHTHEDFETRFFVEGQGLFYIRAGGCIYGVLCTRGDLLNLPANVSHWFDLGAEPSLKAIRLFTTPEGWVAKYTGDSVATRFPRLEAPHYRFAA